MKREDKDRLIEQYLLAVGVVISGMIDRGEKVEKVTVFGSEHEVDVEPECEAEIKEESRN